MIAGWRERGLTKAVVVEPARAAVAALKLPASIATVDDAAAIPADFKPDVVVIAVKPQTMDEVAPKYRRFADAGVPIVSIAAGKTLGYFAKLLGADAAVVRVMPNLPASIGRGISVAVASKRVSGAARDLAEALLAACGEVAWVEDEGLIDAVTALSGSGPAYVFLLAEVMAEAGVACGLPPALAQRLARVTSPGGTTQAAVETLQAGGFETLLDRAITRATERGRELSAAND